MPTDASGKNITPGIINGSTSIPVKALGQALGAAVSYDGGAQTVVIKTGVNAVPNTGANTTVVTTPNVIKIGVMEPVTGGYAAGGYFELEGLKLANKLYPEILGKNIELVIVDNKSDKTPSANAAKELIETEGVNAIIGSWGGSLSIAADPVALKKRTLKALSPFEENLGKQALESGIFEQAEKNAEESLSSLLESLGF